MNTASASNRERWSLLTSIVGMHDPPPADGSDRMTRWTQAHRVGVGATVQSRQSGHGRVLAIMRRGYHEQK